MKIKDIMTKNVELVKMDDTVKEAAIKMKDLDVGSIPVSDGNLLQGMLTDRDITVRVVAEGLDSNKTRVKEVMTPDVVYCYEDQAPKEAARVMAQHQIRRLPILDMQKHLVGIVSLGDISVEAKSDKMAGDALQKISEPSKLKK